MRYGATPLLDRLLPIIIFIGTPILFYILFKNWGDSLSRQAVFAAVIIGALIFSFTRDKGRILVLMLVFTSQFMVSFYSFQLNQPVTLPVTLFDALLLLLVIYFFEVGEQLKVDGLGRCLVALVGLQVVLTVFSAHTNQSLLFSWWAFKLCLLYLLVSNLHLRPKVLMEGIPIAVAATLLIQGSITLVQYLNGGYIGLAVLGERDPTRSVQFFVNDALRASGTLGATNALGGYLAMLLVFLLPFVIGTRQILFKFCFIVGAIAIVIPLSRAAWLSFFIGAGLVFFRMQSLRLVTRGRAWGMASVMFLAIATIGTFNHENISNRFEDKRAMASAEGRLTQFPFAFEVFSQRPLQGLGPGVTAFFGMWNDHNQYLRERLPGIKMHNQVHNAFLQYLIELGVLGGALFLVLVLLVVRSISTQYRRGNQFSVLRLACSCGALVYLIDAQFGTEINNQRMFSLFLIFMGVANNKYLIGQIRKPKVT